LPLAPPTCSNPQLSYFGGPIVQSPVIESVFWGSHVNATLQANIPTFYGDVTRSTFWGWLQEYDTVPHNPGSAQDVLPGSAGGTFTIAPLLCTGTTACTLTDAQLEAELTRQINLGVLPAPAVDCSGNATTIYMVHFPPNITLQAFGLTSCAQGGFCAYHSTTTFGAAGTALLYAAIMDVFTGPCTGACGTNPTALENATSVASHELVETVTDPDIGLDTQNGFAFPAGWGDNNNNCGEIGDICQNGDPGDTITVNGRAWIVQRQWSNRQNACVSSGPVSPVCAGTTLTNCRACSCGDNSSACGGAQPVCETTRTNALFGACEQCTATSGTCGSAKCVQSANPAQDDVCAAPAPLPPWATGVTGAWLLFAGVRRWRAPRRRRPSS
jgi:hypothetical protein